MTAEVACFLDTNILVYAVSSAPSEQGKKQIALALVDREDFGLSAQVLQELYVTVTRKIATPLPPEQAVNLIDELRRFPLIPIDYPLVVAGVECSLKHGLSHWDGTIVAAAERLGAEVLFTEDLSHGQLYGSVRAVNPFLDRPADGVVHQSERSYG